MCTEAQKAAAARWRAAHKEQNREITKAWYTVNKVRDKENRALRRLAIKEAKAGSKRPTKCSVCKRSGRICLDHDHATGLFRGWLCLVCNYALGHVSDSAKVLRKLAVYIERPLKSSIYIMYGYGLKKRVEILGIAPLQCEVCGKPGRICVDHCHKTKLFRGWLCSGCNVTLGYVKDSPKLLRKLADYLDQHEEKGWRY